MKKQASRKGAKPARRSTKMVPAVVSIPVSVNKAAQERGREQSRTRKRVLSEAVCRDFGVDLDKVAPITPMQQRRPWKRPDAASRGKSKA